jgi:hypothetical protein
MSKDNSDYKKSLQQGDHTVKITDNSKLTAAIPATNGKNQTASKKKNKK